MIGLFLHWLPCLWNKWRMLYLLMQLKSDHRFKNSLSQGKHCTSSPFIFISHYEKVDLFRKLKLVMVMTMSMLLYYAWSLSSFSSHHQSFPFLQGTHTTTAQWLYIIFVPSNTWNLMPEDNKMIFTQSEFMYMRKRDRNRCCEKEWCGHFKYNIQPK